jgi:hypothetical protein
MTAVVANTNEDLAIPCSIKNKYYLHMKCIFETQQLIGKTEWPNSITMPATLLSIMSMPIQMMFP